MELEKIQINEKQKDNNIIITESKIHNIETSESINIPKNEKNELKNIKMKTKDYQNYRI